ncbi:hypothetical protein K466DRAFT_227830 [Polyporus arcularius HHB13444]|uniref:Uncharacterized protein n=1 Tax=Polyporus arcularius HHB13444 TaxID=1314778 RepID=A0A5C3PRP8_9APHY|nr:hypothetical protein K466DRAFT_227830 [Polyporus arcularius HHB13444]
MSYRPQNTAATDGAGFVEPQQTLQEPHVDHAPDGLVGRLSASAASPANPSAPDPFVCAELRSLSDKSEATFHTHGAAMAMDKASSGNAVRVVSLPNYKNRPLVRIECSLRNSESQECVLHREDDSQEISTMGDALRVYAERVESIHFDASLLPVPYSGEAIAPPATLPFPPPFVATTSHSVGHANSQAMPFLVFLRDMSITSNRAVSVRSLIEFLHYCPMLRTLAVHSSREHPSVLPEGVDDLAEPSLPYLQQLTMDGLLTHTAEMLLGKLQHSLTESTKVQTDFYETGFPVLQHGPALQKLLLPIRHANVFYACLAGDSDDSSQSDAVAPRRAARYPYLFTFADPTARVRLNWHWAPERDAPPNLSHIGLSSSCLRNVRTLSLSTCNVDPSCVDLFMIMQSFRALRRVEVHATQISHDTLATAQSPETPPATAASSSAVPDPDLTVTPALTSSSCTSRYSLYRVRGGVGTVLRHLANMPLLFSVAIAHTPHAKPVDRGETSGAAGTPARPSLQRLVRFYYEPLRAVMVRRSTLWEP